MQQWNKIVGGDAAETGAGPGSYDIRKSVWHVNVSTSAQVNCLSQVRNHAKNANSAVVRKSMVVEGGEYSMHCSGGRIRPLMEPSSLTICIGSQSLPVSSC